MCQAASFKGNDLEEASFPPYVKSSLFTPAHQLVKFSMISDNNDNAMRKNRRVRANIGIIYSKLAYFTSLNGCKLMI